MSPQTLKKRFLVSITLATIVLASVVALDNFGDSEVGRLTYAESRSHIQSLLNVDWPTAFGSEDEGRWLLQGGFLHSEPDGAWLKEGTGSILLYPDGIGEAAHLSLEFVPALNTFGDAPHLQVTSSAATRFFQLAPSGSTVLIPVAALGLEEVKITCGWPLLGRGYGEQSDLRNLCAKLYRASLDGI